MFNKIMFLLVTIGVFCSAQAVDWTKVSQEAIKQNKLILVSVEREGCHYCEKMNKEVFKVKTNKTKISKDYVHMIVKINEVELPKSIKEVKYFPSNYILNPKDMSVVDQLVGYMKPDDFLSLLKVEYDEEEKNN